MLDFFVSSVYKFYIKRFISKHKTIFLVEHLCMTLCAASL